MADTSNNLPSGAGSTTGSTTAGSTTTGSTTTGSTSTGSTTSTAAQGNRTSGSTGSSTRTETGYSGGSDFDTTRRESSYQPYGGGYERTGREVVLAERQSSTPSTAVVLGAALAGAIAGGAIPFMLSGMKSSNTRFSRSSERSDLHSDHVDHGTDARAYNKSGTNR
jgi:cobalamin biosynthesis Mg chelatase CobN